MHHVARHIAGKFADRGEPADRLALHLNRMGVLVVVGMSLAGRDPLPGQFVDESAVLGVETDRATEAAGRLQRLEDLVVLDHHGWAVGHVHLERRHALTRDSCHLVGTPGGPFQHSHVKGVVAPRFAGRLSLPVGESLGQRLALLRGREIHHQGGAAEHRCAGAGIEIVDGRGALGGQIEVGVSVDAARQHQAAAGVDQPVSGSLGDCAERGDLLTVDPQIGDGRPVRTDDRAAPNDGAHARFSFPMRMTRPGLAAVEA